MLLFRDFGLVLIAFVNRQENRIRYGELLSKDEFFRRFDRKD
jgi:hypothetical protein